MKTLSNSPLKGEDSGSQVSPLRGNCPLEAEQLGSVSDGGPKGLEGSLPCCYLAPVSHYSAYYRADEVRLEVCDNFTKQTLRNRCYIDSPNGALALTIPVVKTEGKTMMKDIRISDHGNWRHQHWVALESSYRQSPFFEYYEDDLRPFFTERRWERLTDFNADICRTMCRLLDIHPDIKPTTEYSKNGDFIDFREAIRPKHPLPDADFQPRRYWQVFEQRHGFLPNLSILDLLFNMGPEAIFYLI